MIALIGQPGPTRDGFERVVEGFSNLAADPGKAPVTKWPILTVLPFAARPDAFMFVKPEATKSCAERVLWDIRYEPRLNWTTYESILAMSRWLLGKLQSLGARDFIDVQSFIWVVAEYTDEDKLSVK